MFVQILKYFCTNFEIYLFKFYTDPDAGDESVLCYIFCSKLQKQFARISRREFDADVRKRDELRQISSQSLQALLSGCGLTTVTTVVSSRLRLARVWKQ